MGRGQGEERTIEEVERFALDSYLSVFEEQQITVELIERKAAGPMGAFALDTIFNDQALLQRVQEVSNPALRKRIGEALFSDAALDTLFGGLCGGLGEGGLATCVYQAGGASHTDKGGFIVEDEHEETHYRDEPYGSRTLCGQEIDFGFRSLALGALARRASSCSDCANVFRARPHNDHLKLGLQMSHARPDGWLDDNFQAIERRVREALRQTGEEQLFDGAVKRSQQVTDPLYEQAIEIYSVEVIDRLIRRSPAARQWALFTLANGMGGLDVQSRCLSQLGESIEITYPHYEEMTPPDRDVLQQKLQRSLWLHRDTIPTLWSATSQVLFAGHYCALRYPDACDHFYFNSKEVGKEQVRLHRLWQQEYGICKFS